MGLRWRVGDGKSIRVFKDPWPPRSVSFRPISQPSDVMSNLLVADLLNLPSNSSPGWNTQLLKSVFNAIDVETILSILVGVFRKDDSLI